eukprot:3428618-Rhodomonas_salina.1
MDRALYWRNPPVVGAYSVVGQTRSDDVFVDTVTLAAFAVTVREIQVVCTPARPQQPGHTLCQYRTSRSRLAAG